MDDLFRYLQETLGDGYKLEREITGGGMSRLFLAADTSLDRQVVIKVLPPDFSSEVGAARFKREIDLTAHLQHPHILPVLAAGAKDGLMYYVMPFIAGESLRHKLDFEKILPVVEACRLLREVADALAYAHEQGVVHRDLKPENILLQGNHAILADFGIASALMAAQAGIGEHQVQAERLTGTGMSVGTPGYMAPEQLVGEREIDGRADIYSLGMVAYEMLSGTRPFAHLTGAALLIARLTEAPDALDVVRPEVPAELSETVMKALAKDPEDRFRWATEFHDAIEASTPTRSSRGITPRVSTPAATVSTLAPAAAPANLLSNPRLRTWRWAGAATAVLIVAGASGWFVRARIAGPASTPNRVAIAPFATTDPELREVWREGLVDVLSRNLDGMGPLHTVSPTIVLRRWPKDARADTAGARELGQSTGAQYVVYGNLDATGTDSVRLKVHVFDLQSGTLRSVRERRDAAKRMTVLTDSITVALLRELGQAGRIGELRGTSLGASTLEALKAFLQGEHFYRRSAWDTAFALYKQAIEIDTAFTLALRRAGQTRGWIKSASDSLSRDYLLRAGALNTRLAPRDSLLTVADSLNAALWPLQDDTAYDSHLRRLFATLGTARDRYREDPETWYALTDAHYHWDNPDARTRMADSQMLRGFQRAISLDSSFTPAYIHAVEFQASLNGADSALRYARAYLKLDPRDEEAPGIALVAKLLEAKQINSANLKRQLDTIPLHALEIAWVMLRRWPDPGETAIQLARMIAGSRLPETASQGDSVLARLQLAAQLAWRGHGRQAAGVVGGGSRLFSDLARLGFIPPDSAARVFAGWLERGPSPLKHALSWWATRGDTASIRLALERLNAHLGDKRSAPGSVLTAKYAIAAAIAYQSLARRDTTAALALFLALPDSLCPDCFNDRLVRARLQASRGQLREAFEALGERLPTLLTSTEILFALERGRIAQRLGNTEAATKAYTRVAKAWLNADPELLPLVEEARRGAGLRSEKRVAAAKAP